MKALALFAAVAAIAVTPSLVLAQTVSQPQLPPSAQERHPIPEQPNTAPFSPAHQQAQLSNLPGQCATATARASDNVGLRIQQPQPGAETRSSQAADLQAAAAFAAAGDDDGCWHWYDRAMQVVR